MLCVGMVVVVFVIGFGFFGVGDDEVVGVGLVLGWELEVIVCWDMVLGVGFGVVFWVGCCVMLGIVGVEFELVGIGCCFLFGYWELFVLGLIDV